MGRNDEEGATRSKKRKGAGVKRYDEPDKVDGDKRGKKERERKKRRR